jgi:hypothetical protein
MATTTVSTNITNSTAATNALTLASGDTVNLLPDVGILNYGTGQSSGIQAGGSNSFVLDGDVFSMNWIAVSVAAGNNDINVGAASTLLGHVAGIFVAGNGSTISVAGDVIGTGAEAAGSFARAILIQGQNNTINVLTGGELFGATHAILTAGNGSNMITVAGRVTSGSQEAISLSGGSNVVTIADTGTVIGQTRGVLFNSGGTGANQVVNHGWLQAVGDAVRAAQSGTVITNTGTMIGGANAINIFASTGKSTLINSGVVAGGTGLAYSGASNVDEIINTGTILGFGTGAINTFGGDDVITNNGVVQGNASFAIDLGEGHDIYNGAGGVVNGKVIGGDGNEIMIGGASTDVFDGGPGPNTMSGGGGGDNLMAVSHLNVANGDDGADQLFFAGNQNQLFGGNDNDWLGVGGNNNALAGSAGDDMLGATGAANTLAGNDGNDNLSANGSGNFLYGQIGNDYLGVSGNNNVLDGAQGDDYIAASGDSNTLDGGAGNDQLVAGGHAGDRFVFHPGYGMDSITGFLRHGSGGDAGGTDVIDVNGFGLNFTTIQAFMADAGGNCVITLNGADVLTVIGVTKAQFLASDFIF